MPDAPIYILGTERSGSNLLRQILDAHSRVCVPHPPHLVHLLEPRVGPLLALPEPQRRLALARVAVALVERHIHPWPLRPDPAQIAAAARPADLVGVMAALYDAARLQAGKARWGNKSTFLLHHVDRLLARDPDAGLIWLVRDPRDVAVSSRDSVFNPCHPRRVAALWARQQAEGLRLRARLGDRLHLLRYEDLLADPEGRLRALCAHLGEAYEPGMLRFFERDAAKQTAALSASWQNAGRGILAGNTGRWVGALADRDRAELEALCAAEMDALGYARDPELRPPADGALRRAAVALGEARGRARVEWRSLRGDRNHWARWRRRAWLSALPWRLEQYQG